MSIESSDISIVVQGAVMGGSRERYSNRATARCLDNLRALFPHAEIILSTWEAQDTADLSCDKLILNCDPGGIDFAADEVKANNGNRQIISTLAGIRNSTRKYVFKVRSDLVFGTNRFVDYFGKYPARNAELKLFKERILVCAIYTKKCSRFASAYRARPFHVSDWVSFGLHEDMLLLWDIPLMPEPLTSRFFQSEPPPAGDQFPQHLWLFSPEQSNWISVLARKFSGVMKPPHKIDDRDEIRRDSDLSIVNNFVVLDQYQFMLYSQKLKLLQHTFEKDDYWQLMLFSDWQVLYRNYCDPSYRPVQTQNDWLRLYRDIKALDLGKRIWNESEDGGFHRGKQGDWGFFVIPNTLRGTALFLAGFLKYLSGSWVPLKRLKRPKLDLEPRPPVSIKGFPKEYLLEKVQAAMLDCHYFGAPPEWDALKGGLRGTWERARARIDFFGAIVNRSLTQIRDILLHSGIYAEVVMGNGAVPMVLMPRFRSSLQIYPAGLKTIVRMVKDPVTKVEKETPVLPEPQTTLRLVVTYEIERDIIMLECTASGTVQPFISRPLLPGPITDLNERVVREQLETVFRDELIPRMAGRNLA